MWSGGSFIYVPKGVHVEIPLQAYFRINTENMGQFERTLIIVDEDAYVHYVEGCTAPIYSSDSLHSAVVEIIVKKGARCRYTTIQNWSANVYNLVTKRAVAQEGATMEWIDGNIGSKVTMKYPAVYLMGEHARGETLSVAFAGTGQHQDAGAKMVHCAPNTSSQIVSKSVARAGGRTSYRGLVQVQEGAAHSKSTVKCDALLVDTVSRSDTYPYVDVREDDVEMGHEATVSKISEEQLFYLMSRGMTEDEAMATIVRGLRGADRARAADGIRARAEPADRAADGRSGRLMSALQGAVEIRRPRFKAARAAVVRSCGLRRAVGARGGVALHTRCGGCAGCTLTAICLRGRCRWQSMPPRVSPLRGPNTATPGSAPPLSLVTGLARGRSRHSLTRQSSTSQIARNGVAPTWVTVRGEGAAGAAFGHMVVNVAPNARATVVLEYTGSATYADNVELVVGDGAALSWCRCRSGLRTRCICRTTTRSSARTRRWCTRR